MEFHGITLRPCRGMSETKRHLFRFPSLPAIMTKSAMVENHHIARFGAFLMAMVTLATLAAAPQPEPVRYTVSFPSPSTHYAAVEAEFPTGGRGSIEVFMPVWTPGSYLVREFSRNVEDVRGPGAVVKTTK